MSEVEARPPPTRGRSSTRGGRGGFGRGGPRGPRKPTNGTVNDTPQVEESLEDQGELGEMKKKYSAELGMLKDMFPDWTDVDLVFALQEADGDVPSTVDHITQGSVSQFAEVKKTKDRARSKAKEEPTMAGATDKPTTRGGRGRGGFEGARGGRARGSERGRGGSRGGRGGHATTNGTPKDAGSTSVPTHDSAAWGDKAATETANGGWDTATPDATADAAGGGQDAAQSQWANMAVAETMPAATTEAAKSSLIPEGGAKKSWASIFQPKLAPPAPAAKQPSTAHPPPAEIMGPGEMAAQHHVEEHDSDALPAPPTVEEPIAEAPLEPSPLEAQSMTDGEELAITPSKDPLTEANVEHLPDESHPPSSQTVASTIGSMDPRNLTPLPSTQQAPIGRPPMGGYAASAYRATGQPGRSASFQRRVLEQQEPVVMPGHNAVDRAAVQFGSMGINGEPGLDVDEDREDAETRQAPQHSPPSQPKTSLPPAPRQMMASQEPGMPEGLPTPKAAPGLPPASHQNQQQMQEATMAPGLTQDQAQMNPSYNQYARYGQPSMQQEPHAQQHKAFDPFSHQAQATQYDQYGTHAQQLPQQQQQQQQSQSGFGSLSSAPNDYSSYYTTTQEPRNSYNQYYGSSYGPQDARSQAAQGHQPHQDLGLGQQRSASGFGAGSQHESAFASQAPQQVSTAQSFLTPEAARADLDEGEERRILLKEVEQGLLRSPLVEQNRRPSFRRNPRPEDMLETHANVAKRGLASEASPLPEARFKFAPFEEVTNRNPILLSSPHPKVFLSDPIPQQAQSRYGDAGSGHNTPNPLMGGQQQNQPNAQQQGQHSMHQGQGSHQQQQGGYGASAAAAAAAGFPYGHPYYNSPYQHAYQNQYGAYQPPQLSGYGSGGGGGGTGFQGQGKQQGGMYGGPQSGYGMGSHSSYEQQSSSPANNGAFGQNQQTSMRSTSGMGSGLGGLDDYARQSAPQQQQQSSAFGGMNDPFARSTSGFGGQSAYGQSMSGQDDSLKPLNETKSGHSPAFGQPGRPGSAANGAAAQTGLPPPQSHQSGFGGGYPGFPGQGSQYGGLGGLGSQQQQQPGQSGMGGGQQQQQGAYGGGGAGAGGYGANAFSQTYGGYGAGSRGWGTNYGAH